MELARRLQGGGPGQWGLRLLLHFVGKVRRFWLVHGKKSYVAEKLAARRGECRQCGRCCAFIFRCLMLDQEGLCRGYHTCRWAACKVFPIDERDLVDVALTGGRCGYRFEPASAGPAPLTGATDSR
jgi:hypothetical protein